MQLIARGLVAGALAFGVLSAQPAAADGRLAGALAIQKAATGVVEPVGYYRRGYRGYRSRGYGFRGYYPRRYSYRYRRHRGFYSPRRYFRRHFGFYGFSRRHGYRGYRY